MKHAWLILMMICSSFGFLNSASAADPVGEATITVKSQATVAKLLQMGTETGEKMIGKENGYTVLYDLVRINQSTVCFEALRVIDRDFFVDWSWSLKTADYCEIK